MEKRQSKLHDWLKREIKFKRDASTVVGFVVYNCTSLCIHSTDMISSFPLTTMMFAPSYIYFPYFFFCRCTPLMFICCQFCAKHKIVEIRSIFVMYERTSVSPGSFKAWVHASGIETSQLETFDCQTRTLGRHKRVRNWKSITVLYADKCVRCSSNEG